MANPDTQGVARAAIVGDGDGDLDSQVRTLYRQYGYSKSMGTAATTDARPHYFLHRRFAGEQDLLTIFNTKRCHYQCRFCALPFKSARKDLASADIVAQFLFVVGELRHSLSILERVTFSNEGSVLDRTTFPREALLPIVRATVELRNVKTLVLETRLEFADTQYLEDIRSVNPMVRLNILTGFETLDQRLRDEVLRKQEPIDTFVRGLDELGRLGISLTTYVLFKPDPRMTDDEGFYEADRSINFLKDECDARGIPLLVRLNPMYGAWGTPWYREAQSLNSYEPPKLSDVLRLARDKRKDGVRIYVGLSAEGLGDISNTYRARDDFSDVLLREAIAFNQD